MKGQFVRNRITDRIGEVLSTYKGGWMGVLYDGRERKDEHADDLCLVELGEAELLLFGDGITSDRNHPPYYVLEQ